MIRKQKYLTNYNLLKYNIKNKIPIDKPKIVKKKFNDAIESLKMEKLEYL